MPCGYMKLNHELKIMLLRSIENSHRLGQGIEKRMKRTENRMGCGTRNFRKFTEYFNINITEIYINAFELSQLSDLSA